MGDRGWQRIVGLNHARCASAAQTFQVLHQFTGFTDGSVPEAFLTDLNSGPEQAGSVYKLTPGDGGWTATDLYDFNGADTGAAPFGNVVLDANGDVYGTTTLGGTHNLGIVFEITQ